MYCQITFKSIERFKQGARQTDHATEKCVGRGGITCAARGIPPKNETSGYCPRTRTFSLRIANIYHKWTETQSSDFHPFS